MSSPFQKIYNDIASSYELVNHVMTGGLDFYWRKKAAGIATSNGGSRWLDVCSGTGDMLRNLDRLAGPEVRLHAADFSMSMLSVAKDKSINEASFCLANVDSLPYADNSFDLATVSFATRNLNQSREILTKRFAEIHRVLKPGGRFMNLETSQPPSSIIRVIFNMYVAVVVKPVGRFISGKESGYAYLAKSIGCFYGADELREILKDAGFSSVDYERFTFGAVAAHVAVK